MKAYAKRLVSFPDPRLAADDGLVAIGDDMSVERLLEAYSFGIFPWPHPDLPTLWFSPDPRGILDFSDLKISRSLEKLRRKNPYRISFNEAFSEVVGNCAVAPRPGQSGSWISPQIEKCYQRFHEAGYAHSVECWRERDLVGGLYGVYVGGVFSGESMFHREDNTSKLCLVAAIEALKANGLDWMDIQMVTDHLRKMGGRYIPREEYLQRLDVAKKNPKPLRWMQV